jgi:hypothetical protein
MYKLYKYKGGKENEDGFNCVTLKLTEADLKQLAKDTEADKLPHTDGFFFGISQPGDKEDTLYAVAKCLGNIDGGYNIFYTSSW